MTIQLRPDLEKLVSERVLQGDFESPNAVVDRAVSFFLEYDQDEMVADEFVETRDAIAEGMAQADRGEGISLADFDSRMRSRHGIPR